MDEITTWLTVQSCNGASVRALVRELRARGVKTAVVSSSRNCLAAAPQAVVVEDALSGVESGRNGGFGLVVGVNRAD